MNNHKHIHIEDVSQIVPSGQLKPDPASQTRNGRTYRLIDAHGEERVAKAASKVFLEINKPLAATPIKNDIFKYIEINLLHLTAEMERVVKATNGDPSTELETRRKELAAQQRQLNPSIQKSKRENPEFYAKLDECLKDGTLTQSMQGAGGAYFLCDPAGKKVFVVKPGDQDIFHMNNNKGNGQLDRNAESRVREAVPLYTSAQNEALVSAQAELAGLPHVVPKTVLAVIEHEKFYDLTDTFFAKHPNLDPKGFGATKKKLCSVQEYVPQAKSLQSAWAQNLDFSRIDQASYEDAFILTWITYDNDGHSGNYMVYPLQDKTKFGLKKIDSSLSNPNNNSGLLNVLSCFDEAQRYLSPRAKKLIAEIPVEKIVSKMKELGKSGESIYAFRQRMKILKEVANQKNISLANVQRQMNLRLWK